jgi:hypothetical protein
MRLSHLSAVALLCVSGAASAAVTLDFSQKGTSGVDAAFEGPGGYLNGTLGLPLVPPANQTALPPVERAVGQVRSGANPRNGLFLPTAATGIPVEDGGTGVTVALTNVAPFATTNTDFFNGVSKDFTISRTGNVVTFVFGADTFTSNARTSLGGANAIEFRIRTQSGEVNDLALTNLVFNDSLTTDQSLAAISAENGEVAVDLWSGIVGDFQIRGTFTATWTGNRPGGSALATQWKLLTLPTGGVIPEPATWAMMIAGFGLVGAAARRRQAVTSA